MEPQRKYLRDYQPPRFQVDHLDLHFDLGENKTRVTSSMALVRKTQGPLELDGVNLELVSVSLVNSTGQKRELSSRDYRLEDEKLIISDLPEKATIEIVTDIKPQENTSLEGLYKSDSIFCTQCEAQGFRKITYFLDRPDVMTSYTVTIEADEKKYPVLLSNGDRVSVKSLGQGRHQAVWRDPHKKPSYLFALVAGDLGVIQDHFVTQSGREVQLEIFATHGKQDRCHHAMVSLKKSMKWDEVRFGREYDLANFMIVAIDDFNGGAMENKGLNIFNSRLIMADSKIATDADYMAIESVVAHEYFHNWTGNRVTLRDWFQLSLKEGLTVFRDQEFSADVGDRGLQRIRDVDQLRDRQFVEDGGPNAHPVRPDSCLSVDNFYTATIYEKGAELIRMMQILTGRQGFRKGMDFYFEKYDGQAVTTEDFAQAISEPNNLDLTQFKLWYSQFGTPKVEVSEKFDLGREEYYLTLKQSLGASDRQPMWQAFHIPVLFGLLTAEGGEISVTSKDAEINSDGEPVLQLREMEQTFVFKGLKSKPIPSLFREFSAPVDVHWEAPLEERLVLMNKDRDGFNRRETAQKIYLEVFQTFMKVVAQKSSDGNLGLVPLSLLDAIREIVRDAKMDTGFKAAMLTWPADSILAQSVEVIDIQALRRARESFQRQVAEFCEADLRGLYQDLHQAPYLDEMSTRAYGVRSLKNRALEILQSLKQNSVERLIEAQYYKSENMTDRLSALFLLVDGADSQTRQGALEHFRAEFEKDALVLNKWFGVQAAATHAEVFGEVQKLVNHPLFQVNNPNHVYSLMRTFGNNFVVFNDPKNDCYRFYLKFIETLDAKNPQVAARLCGAFNLYKKLKPDQQKNLIQEVKTILAQPSLSKNTRELLEKIT